VLSFWIVTTENKQSSCQTQTVSVVYPAVLFLRYLSSSYPIRTWCCRIAPASPALLLPCYYPLTSAGQGTQFKLKMWLKTLLNQDFCLFCYF